MDRSPEVQDVALGAAFRMNAMKQVLLQVGRKRTVAVAGFGVDRAASTSLRLAAQFGQASQVSENLFHRDLLTQGFEIDLFAIRHRGSLARCRLVGHVGQRRVDGVRRLVYLGVSRGDHLLFGHSPVVARGCFFFFLRSGLSPGVVAGIERSVGLPHGEDQVQHLLHAVSKGNVAPLAAGFLARVQRTECRVVLATRPAGHVEVAADQVVPLARHLHRARRARLAAFVHAGAVLFGEDPEIADQFCGRLEAVDGHDLGHDHGRGRGQSP